MRFPELRDPKDAAGDAAVRVGGTPAGLEDPARQTRSVAGQVCDFSIFGKRSSRPESSRAETSGRLLEQCLYCVSGNWPCLSRLVPFALGAFLKVWFT